MIKVRVLVGLLLSATVLTTSGLGARAATPAATHYTGALADGAAWVADVPPSWNGTTILYSHGFGPLTAKDAPDDATETQLLAAGYALVGSSYSGPSWWALKSAVDDQFGALAAISAKIGRPHRAIAWGTSMGGLVSALEAERGNGRIAGSLTTCGLVAGALNLNNYQLDGAWAINRLLAPKQSIQLVNYASTAAGTTAANALAAATKGAQTTAAGRARTALVAALFNAPTWYSGTAAPAANDYDAQEAQQAAELTEFMIGFQIPGRYQIELAAGGNSSFNVGVDYARLIRRSPDLAEIRALYKKAGIDLGKDLQTLSKDATVHGNPAAAASLRKSSQPTGRITVPELDIHTIYDQLVPVEQENWYAQQVARAGRSSLLRQAYVNTTGHCKFQPSETISALHALEGRIRSGHWGSTTTPEALNASGGRYVEFTAPPLTGTRR